MPSVSCSICWELVTSTCIASYLTCGHVYHNNCLDKWLKTAKTCPECRNAALSMKRIYLNLVPDPEVEGLNLDLTIATTKLELEKIENQLQATKIGNLKVELRDKDELLLASAKKNDEVKLESYDMLHQNEKLKLELRLQEKQQILLTNEISKLEKQLQVSKTKNIEITKSTVDLKKFNREQVTQISDLHSQILDLTERLNHFRSMFTATDNKLQAQVQENQIMKMERDSLMSRNTYLYQKMYRIKLQSAKKFLRKIKQNSSSLKSQSRRRNVKRERLKKQQPNYVYQCRDKSNGNLKVKLIRSDNLKMKLVKSELDWMCVK